MTNTFNKVLSVFVAVASMVFLGLIVAYTAGGVNWSAEIQANDLSEYSFQLSEGEDAKWTVTGPNGPMPSVPKARLADAVVKARKDLDSRQKAELRMLRDEIPNVDADLNAIRELKQIDTDAMTRRQAEVKSYLAELHKDVLQQSDIVTKRVRETTDTRTEAENRRKDVYRLTNELEVLRTDRARLVGLRRELADELLRLQIHLNSLKQRASQSQDD
ncbi:MAG: hypothetical protein AB8G99_24210 [Planctomycetaceae bacterium]